MSQGSKDVSSVAFGKLDFCSSLARHEEPSSFFCDDTLFIKLSSKRRRETTKVEMANLLVMK